MGLFGKVKCHPTTRVIVPLEFNDFRSNRIKTTKYNFLTFIPKNLFEQFHRFANVFFLFITLLNWIPVISAFAREVALVPVLFVLLVTAVKDGFEDFRRRRSDRRVNRQLCQVYNSLKKKYVRREWQDVHVGDILHISCDEVIPADVVLLHSSDYADVCFIETSNLDGETNLKQREIVSGNHSKKKFHPTDFCSCIECELPNNEIYKFNGSIILEDGSRIPVSKDNLLLRGCTLRNTNYVEAIVVYAGHDTKALLNNRGPRYKRSRLERQINRDVIWCVVILGLLCGGGGLGHGLWMSRLGELTSCVYIGIGLEEMDPAWQGFITFWSLLILLQVMIPLPMYVTIELVKLGQVYFIQQDLEAYHAPTDRPIQCRALNITEDLGQVQYLFSDKTGTLTENRMTFKNCTIGGVDYTTKPEDIQPTLPLPDQASEDDIMEEFTVNEWLRQTVANLKFNACQNPHAGSDIASDLSGVKPQPGSDLHKPEGVSDLNRLELSRIHDFFILLAVCNTVVVSSAPHHDTTLSARRSDEDEESSSGPETPSDGTMQLPHMARSQSNPGFQGSLSDDSGLGEAGLCYEAESQDELALVKAAMVYGIKLIRRTPGTITIWTPAEGELTLTILHVLKFDSERKRMSVLVQYPDSRQIVLLCKGADTAIIGSLAMDRDCVEIPGYEDMVKNTDEHLSHYAKQGLRTLCMAKKLISQKEYEAWYPEYCRAQSAMENRDKLVSTAITKIESGLTLLGATGIEDQLQEGVPETIQALREAGISVWVLTGDKQETAINIAYSCRLITNQHLLIINIDTEDEVEDLVKKQLRKLSNLERDRKDVEVKGHMQKHKHKQQYALVVDGTSLGFALSSCPEEFLQLAEQCYSVLCCRATPIQKAKVVKLVKEKLGDLTLAIGDGANDVSMIQTADVGVGISGQEGMQAVMASDFALAQFRFLRRLLLVHGHWSYDRLARTALYMFYKSAAFVFLLFWYQVHNGFSASTSVDQYYTIFHNLLYTSIPPVVLGIFDQDLPAKVLSEKPWLYKAGPASKSYQSYSYFLNVFDALYQSAMVYFISFLAYETSTVGMAEFGTTCITGCVVCALCTIAIETKTFTWPSWLSLLLSILLMWITMICTSLFSLTSDPPLNPYWVFFEALSSPLYYLTLILSTITALLPRLFFRSFKATIDPSPASIERQIFVDAGPVDRESSVTSLRDVTHRDVGSRRDFGASAASIASRLDRSMKSLRHLPPTTHIVAVRPPLLTQQISHSVPSLKDRPRAERKDGHKGHVRIKSMDEQFLHKHVRQPELGRNSDTSTSNIHKKREKTESAVEKHSQIHENSDRISEHIDRTHQSRNNSDYSDRIHKNSDIDHDYCDHENDINVSGEIADNEDDDVAQHEDVTDENPEQTIGSLEDRYDYQDNNGNVSDGTTENPDIVTAHEQRDSLEATLDVRASPASRNLVAESKEANC